MKLAINLNLAACIFVLVGGLGSVAQAKENRIPNSWLFGRLNSKSIATKAQVQELHQLVLEEIASGRSNPESLAILNSKLKAQGLPSIESDPEIEIIYGNGFVGSTEGAAIQDGRHLYCLPCKTGWNQYEFGIAPTNQSP